MPPVSNFAERRRSVTTSQDDYAAALTNFWDVNAPVPQEMVEAVFISTEAALRKHGVTLGIRLKQYFLDQLASGQTLSASLQYTLQQYTDQLTQHVVDTVYSGYQAYSSHR